MNEVKFAETKHNVRVPTLLIGIGGIGGRIVTSVYEELNVNDRSCIEAVVFDTNINDLTEVRQKGITCIQTSEGRNVQDYLKARSEFREWFPTNALINKKSLIDGAGQIRAVSRLGALASIQKGNFDKLNVAIDKLKRNRGDDLQSTMKVMIVGSITGGTGSGLAIQLPFYIRKQMAEKANISDVLIRGLFLTADITEGKQQTKESKDAMYVNEYALIRELNAFYKAQATPDAPIKVDVEYYDKGRHNIGVEKDLMTSDNIPYEFLFLVEKVDSESTNIGGLANYEMKAAKIVKTQLFSPVASGQYSAEDNLIMASVPRNGMNKYCGAGISTAIYPQDFVERYCTLRFANESVAKHWLVFDRAFTNEFQANQRMMAHNPSLAPIKRDENYIKQFETKTKQENEGSYVIKQLGAEMYHVDYDEQGKVTGRVEISKYILDKIEEYLKKVMDDAGLEGAKKECQFERQKFDKPGLALKEVQHLFDVVEAYRKLAHQKIAELTAMCAESILPGDLKDAIGTPEGRLHSIYNLLRKRHPLTNRYLVYRLIEEFDMKKKSADAELKNKDTRKMETDDFHKDNGTQNITEAFNRERPGTIRTLGSRVLNVPITSSEYKHIVDNFKKAVEEDVGNIESYAKYKLRSNVYGDLLSKLKMLSKVYEEFFDDMENVISAREEELAVIEKKYNRAENRRINGDWIVCADEICLKSIFADVKRGMKEDMNIVSDDVKEDLLEELYGEAAKRVRNEYDNTYDTGREKTAREILEDGVLDTMKAELLKQGARFTDLGIIGAIIKEYDAYRVYSQNESSFEFGYSSKEEYMSKIFSKLANLARPYLSYQAVGEQELPLAVTYAVNEDVIRKYQDPDGKKCDMTAVEQMFELNDVAENTPIVDSAINKNELICYKAVYGLHVENLHFFKDGNKAHRLYLTRINDVVNKTYKLTESKDSYLAAVHPHLDKRWHNHAYLPLLNDDSDVEEERRIKLSFLLSFALKTCKFGMDYDHGYCWKYVKEHKMPHPFFINNDEVMGNKGVDSLLESFYYNDFIKDDIMKRAREARIESVRNEKITGTDEKTILEHTIIKGFLNLGKLWEIEEGEDNISFRNIFDVLYAIYVKTRDTKKFEELSRVLVSYLYRYCYEMSNQMRVTTEKLLKRIIEEINSTSPCYQIAKKATEGPLQDICIYWDGLVENIDHEEMRLYLEKAELLQSEIAGIN